jgi:hypothetical protein
VLSLKSAQNRSSEICRIFIFVAVFLFAGGGTRSAAAPGPAASETTPEWKTYRYSADGFSVDFPVAPLSDKREIATAAGAYELQSYRAQSGAAALLVGVCDYGFQSEGKTPESPLGAAKIGALTNSSSHLLKEKKIMLGPYGGIEFEAESEVAHMTARLYLVDRTLYQIVVAAPLSQPYGEAARFLNSFQFVAHGKP